MIEKTVDILLMILAGGLIVVVIHDIGWLVRSHWGDRKK